MFINYKIFDSNFQFLGATGIALKISYINDMLKRFRIDHNFIITFFNENGDVILAERDVLKVDTLNEINELKKYKDLILSKDTKIIEYKKNGSTHILNTKYIPELGLYLTVDANLEDFTTNVTKLFYFNIVLSLFMTIIIAMIVYFVIKKHSSKLEYLSSHDTLTEISNRRDFQEKLNNQILLTKRKKIDLAIIFIDIDNFKAINDSLGHKYGDIVLKQVAKVLKNHIRQTDLIARWGGEEFIITLIDSSLEDAKMIAEKLRFSLENDSQLYATSHTKVTASFGLTIFKEDDTQEQVISRADEAMYMSKNTGRNKLSIL